MEGVRNCKWFQWKTGFLYIWSFFMLNIIFFWLDTLKIFSLCFQEYCSTTAITHMACACQPTVSIIFGFALYSGSPLIEQKINLFSCPPQSCHLVLEFSVEPRRSKWSCSVTWRWLTCAGSTHWQLLDWVWQIIHQSDREVKEDKTVRKWGQKHHEWWSSGLESRVGRKQ